MSNSSINQQSRPDPKPEAVTSLVLGIISMLAAASVLIFHFGILTIGWEVGVGIVFWGWLLSIVGIILGIMGLKSVKKKLAIAGLVLSVTGLAAYIYAVTLVFGIA